MMGAKRFQTKHTVTQNPKRPEQGQLTGYNTGQRALWDDGGYTDMMCQQE
jgi:hypothetical protein